SDERSEELPRTESYRRGRKAVSGVVAGGVLAAGAAAAFMRYRPARIAIEGVSMAPTLVPGDWALVVTPDRFHRDDVVVVEHPQRPGYEIVKRLVGVPGGTVGGRELGEDEYWVEGDFAHRSTDSREFGPVSREPEGQSDPRLLAAGTPPARALVQVRRSPIPLLRWTA